MISKSEERFILFILLGLFLLVALKSAWVCDDAYISFRTLGNFLTGHGLRYNLAERVQSYTHPLWLFLLAVPAFFTREPYYTSIFLSILLSLAAVIMLAFGIARSWLAAILAVAVLIFSKAFIDYSTSGLENPLTHFLLAAFCYFLFKDKTDERKLLVLSFIAALGMLSRMDAILLYLPALLYSAWQTRKGWLLTIGFLPFFCWEWFSLLYYGFLFPNTAYAKISTGLPGFLLVRQGFYYLINSLNLDPLTLFVIAAAAVVSFSKKNREMLPLSIGIILYLIYVVKIGGDFMSGRFLSAPLFAAAMLISRMEMSNVALGAFAAVIIALGVSSPFNPIYNNVDYKADRNAFIDGRGVCDERAFYYPELGLLNASRYFKPHQYVWTGARLNVKYSSRVFLGQSNVGYVSFLLDPAVHLVDVYALVDPLLARLPMWPDPYWRIGHFARRVPEGYLDTLRTGRDVIRDKKVAFYYDKLALITRGRLFDAERLKEIIKFNLGYYNYLTDDAVFRSEVFLKEVEKPKAEGTPWNDPSNVFISPRRGLVVNLGKTVFTESVEISLDNNDDYGMEFYRDGQLLARQNIPAKVSLRGGLAVHSLLVPPAAVEKGYNKIKILPKGGDGVYSLGHLQIIP